MRLENLIKPVDEMSHDELMMKIAQIREGRALPSPRSETKIAKKRVKAEDNLRAMFEAMSPAEKEQFMKGLEE